MFARWPQWAALVVVAITTTALAPVATAHAPSAPVVHEVVLAGVTPLRAGPGPSARLIRTLPARAADGAPLRWVTGAAQTVGVVPWVHVSDSAVGGWVRLADASRVGTPSLSSSVRQRLTTLAGRVSGDVGIVVMDRAGHIEWSFHPDRARILASNTKLFVTGWAAHRQARIGGELRSILMPSNNVLAQKMYSAEGGAAPIARFASSLHVSVALTDGSGLSRSNVASPLGVATYLVGMATDQHFGEWFRALPVAGVSGTLADRMVGSPAQGRCHAKTGTLTGVSALSGYCTTVAGRHLVFSILMNGIGNVYQARNVQDRIVEILAQRG